MRSSGSGRPSRGELIRRGEQARFVGRREQLARFADNLARDPFSPEDPADFLFHVHGVGGVGKSTLLRQWREAARRVGAVTAVADENDVHGCRRPWRSWPGSWPNRRAPSRSSTRPSSGTARSRKPLPSRPRRGPERHRPAGWRPRSGWEPRSSFPGSGGWSRGPIPKPWRSSWTRRGPWSGGVGRVTVIWPVWAGRSSRSWASWRRGIRGWCLLRHLGADRPLPQ